MSDLSTLQESLRNEDLDLKNWLFRVLNPWLDGPMACPCPGCHRLGCERFNERLAPNQRLLLIETIIEVVNAERSISKISNSVDVTALLVDWHFWRETEFHIYFPLFHEPLRKELDFKAGLDTEPDHFCRPLKYFETAREMGLSNRVLWDYLSAWIRPEQLAEPPVPSGSSKPRKKPKPSVDLTMPFPLRWDRYIRGRTYQNIHHYFDLSVDYERVSAKILESPDATEILSRFPRGRGFFKWTRLKKKLVHRMEPP